MYQLQNMENGNMSNQTKSSTTAADDIEIPVKERYCDQREALPGEPRCVICGRYGEYICDETNDDICSLECKHILLSKVPKPQLTGIVPPPVKLPTADECYYVRDTTNNKSESQSLAANQTESLRLKLDISVRGECVPAPILSFASCNIPQKLLKNIEVAGYEMPTPVQMQAIPAALIGQSLLVSAETGSGKTASYLVPIISYCVNFNHQQLPNKKPLALVLAPTRELCIQVEEQAKLLGKGLPFKTALVVGGDAMARQLYRIQEGVALIVGTPGRLIDLLTKHDIELDSVSNLVLDEVDCMLEKGFREQVMQIFRALSQPQVLMYSATVSKDVEKMASLMTRDLVIVSVGRSSKLNSAVKQLPIWVESKKKKQKLFDILASQQHFMPPAVVFVGSRLGADLLSEAIVVTTGVKALSIHGEKSMKERRGILSSFLVGEVPVIVATGVLGRGVNLFGVRQVIVFDMPNSMKEYVHQIGRASRMGEEGTAIVFINEENKRMFPELVEILKSSGAAIPRELANSRYMVNSFSTNQGYKKRKHGS